MARLGTGDRPLYEPIMAYFIEECIRQSASMYQTIEWISSLTKSQLHYGQFSDTQKDFSTLWRHQMETFSALLALCEGNPLVTAWFLLQRPVTQSFDICFDLPLNNQLSKQSRCRWFETPSRSLWRHCTEILSCIFKSKGLQEVIENPSNLNENIFNFEIKSVLAVDRKV